MGKLMRAFPVQAKALPWALAGVLSLVAVGSAAALEIGPDADFCTALQALGPGEELVLRAGEYRGPCKIRRGGAPGAPIVLRAADLAQRPRIVYNGHGANVIEVRTSHVVIRGLEIESTQPDVDAVRVYGADDVTVEDCRFVDLGGIAVVANHADVRGLTVRRNEILSSRTTAMYFGCHDGRACVISDLLVEGNYIRHVRAPDPKIGYGVELKLNTVGVIRDNIVVDTKGPGIMVYGATDDGRPSVVERNLVMGSINSAGIVVGGGPAIVRNNITTDNTEAGIALEDYRQRGLLRGVVVLHNSAYQNRGPGVLAPQTGLTQAVIVNNLVAGPAGLPAVRAPAAGVTLAGNVLCRPGECFARPHERDFSPLSATPAATLPAAARRWKPSDDFFGAPRGARPVAGAVEGTAGPIPLGLKP